MANESILIIDDSPLNLKLARVLLQSDGYLVRTASEGNEALSILKTFKPELILMDIQLPGIDGLEVTRRIKANPETQGIIVVALTASAMKGDEGKVLSAGCDGYISKPFESKKLLLWIRQYLDAPRRANNGAALARKCILVVEDDPIETKILCISLEAAGFRTITAEDGADAIEKARLAPPDLIVSDIFMPAVDGFTLCRAARNDVLLASVPIILRTAGDIQKSDKSMARSMGASALVSKDQDIEVLLASVNAALTEEVPILKAASEDVAGITQDFLITGEQKSRHLYRELKTGIDIPAARQLMHQWAGTGGTLGFPQISQVAFDIDTLLELSPSNLEILETRFKELPKLFSEALKDSHKVKPVPQEILIEVLSGRNIALSGFDASEASRTQVLLQRAGATCENHKRAFDITILKVTGEVNISPYAASAMLIVGPREPAIEAQLEGQSHPHDFLLEPYTDEEILVRCS